MDFLAALGRAIRSERAIDDMSARDLAAAAGVSEHTLRKITKGEGDLSYRQAEQIAEVLGISLADLHARAGQIMDRSGGYNYQANSGGQNLIIAGAATVDGDINVKQDDTEGEE